MMEAWEIEQRKRQEKQGDNRPAIDAPRPLPPPQKEKPPQEGGQGGTVIVIPI